MIPTAPQRSRRATFRPTIEVLEERNLLSGGTLDPTFGNGGEATFKFRPGDGSDVEAVAAQPDGNLVVVGYSSSSSQSSLVVERLNSDGSLDTSFGTNGEVTLPQVILQGWGLDNIHVAITTEGKIVVEGLGYLLNSSNGVHLTRLNGDGSLDTSFAGTGSEVFPIPPDESLNALAVQADGKIVLAGVKGDDFIAARFNADGTMDSSFGQEGEVEVSFGPLGATQDIASSVAIQPDGKLILAGEVAIPTRIMEVSLPPTSGTFQPIVVVTGGGSDYIGEGGVARLNADGSLDPGFGQDGRLVLPSFAGISSVAVRTDGEILVAGGSDGISGDPAIPFDSWGVVALLTADGNIDRCFGDAGFVVPPGQMEIWQVLVRSDGSTVLLGEAYPVNGYWGWTVSLLRADGSPDPDFGTNGQVSTSSFPVPSGQEFTALPFLSIQPDGDIVFSDTVAPPTPRESIQESAFLACLTAPPVGATLLPKPPGDQPPHPHVDPIIIFPVTLPGGSVGSTEEPRLPAPVFVVVKESGTLTTRHDSIVAVVIPPADAGLLTFASTRELLSILFSRGPGSFVVGPPSIFTHNLSHRSGVDSGVPPLPPGGGSGGDTPDDAPKPFAVPVGSPIDLPPAVAAAFAVSLPLVVGPTAPDSDADTAPVTPTSALGLYFASASPGTEAIDSAGEVPPAPEDSDD